MTYINLFTDEKLSHHLSDINRQVQEHFKLLVTQMKNTQGINGTTENRKSYGVGWKDELYSSQAEEIILSELIYR